MPHVIVEYSGNIEVWGDPDRIARAVHVALLNCSHLPAESVKTRAIRHAIWHAGTDSGDTKGFVTILIRTRPGREEEVLKAISETARDAVVQSTVSVLDKTLTVSVEVQMMDPVAVVHARI